MRVGDVLRSALGALVSHRRRTAISLIGMSIGTAAVVVLAGLGEGARGFLEGQFESLGSNVITVLPGKVETTGAVPGWGATPNDLTLADARALERGLPAVERVAPVVVGNDTASHGERSRQVLVFGSTAEILAIRQLALRSGRFLRAGAWERGTTEVVLGATLARELFAAESPVGAVLRIGGWRMRVVGVLAPQGVHFGVDLDETAFVQAATAMRMFDRSSLYRIVLQVRPGFELERIERRCELLLRERHGEDDTTITTPDAVLSSVESILAKLTLAIAGIASISLAVAGIGIMNVMLVSISERTKEIGLLKALGATPRQVLSLFVAEAAALSALGGGSGVLLGAALLQVATLALEDFAFTAPAWAVVSALALALGVGVTFGLLPASRAVRLDPVEALSGHRG